MTNALNSSQISGVATSRRAPVASSKPSLAKPSSNSSSITLRLKRDSLAKTFYYEVVIGWSLSSSKMEASGTVPSRNDAPFIVPNDWQRMKNAIPTLSYGSWRDTISTFINIRQPSMQPPGLPPALTPSSTSSSTTHEPIFKTAKTPRSSGMIRPAVLHPALQSYFWCTQRAVSQTLHPLVIHSEALRIAGLLSPPSLSFATTITNPYQKSPTPKHSADPLLSDVINKILLAAMEDSQFVRTMALVVFDMVLELTWRDIHTKNAFERTFVSRFMKQFNEYWDSQIDTSKFSTPTGLDLSPSGFTTRQPHSYPPRTQIMNTAAFAGALYALDILPHASFTHCVTFLILRISKLISVPITTESESCVYLRGLYLLLLNATKGRIVVHHHYADVLQNVKNDLVYIGRRISEGHLAFKVMERRWIIEICGVLDSAVSATIPAREEVAGSPWCVMERAYYRWDPVLKYTSLLERTGGLGDVDRAEERREKLL